MLPRIFVPATQITPQSNPPVFLRWTHFERHALFGNRAAILYASTNVRIVARSAVKAVEARMIVNLSVYFDEA